MTVARDLLREMAPSVGENPLGMLGLSPQILKLGLTDGELYTVCQRMARTLLMEVHEDRQAVTKRTTDLGVRFSQAMQALKSEETFAAALAELRLEQGRESDAVQRARRSEQEWRSRMERAERERDDARVEARKSQQQVGHARREAQERMERARDYEHEAKRHVDRAEEAVRVKLKKRIRVVRGRETRATKQAAELKLRLQQVQSKERRAGRAWVAAALLWTMKGAETT